MQELLLINPRKRRKGRSAAQKAATRKLVASNRSRKSSPKRRRRNPIAAAPAARKSNPRRRSRRAVSARRRRNPISTGGIGKILTPALMGALGATAVNSVVGQIAGYLPASLSTGQGLLVTRAIAALALAMVGGKVGLKGATVTQMAEGSLTVTLHDAIVSLASGAGFTQLQGVRAYPQRAAPQMQRSAPPKLGMHVSNVSQLLPARQSKTAGFSF